MNAIALPLHIKELKTGCHADTINKSVHTYQTNSFFTDGKHSVFLSKICISLSANTLGNILPPVVSI